MQLWQALVCIPANKTSCEKKTLVNETTSKNIAKVYSLMFENLKLFIVYLTLRSVLSLNNPQNSEMKICEIWSSHVENHHNYHRLHFE